MAQGYIIAGIILALMVSHGGMYVKGRYDGKTSITERLANDRITVLQDGKRIDAETIGADDDGVCAMLGGCSVQ